MATAALGYSGLVPRRLYSATGNVLREHTLINHHTCIYGICRSSVKKESMASWDMVNYRSVSISHPVLSTYYSNLSYLAQKLNIRLRKCRQWLSYGSTCTIKLSVLAGVAIVQKCVPYSQRYLFNAIPYTNHNANPTNPNRYSNGNPNPTNPTTRYRCE